MKPAFQRLAWLASAAWLAATSDSANANEGAFLGEVVGESFVAQQTLRASQRGMLYLSMGDVFETLDQPVGSCRLYFDGPREELPAGSRLAVRSVRSARSPHLERGISSVTFIFQPGSPARSLLCDAVGAYVPSLEEVVMQTRGVLQVLGDDESPSPATALRTRR